MMKKRMLGASAAMLLALAGMPAQAATLTIGKWTFENGNRVDVTFPNYTNGRGGGFSGTLSDAGASFDGSIDMYCVELTQSISVPGSWSGYSVLAAASYFTASDGAQLGRLLTHALPLLATASDKDKASTALQLAIWNVVYDSDLTLSAGDFRDTVAGVSSIEQQANDFLNNSQTTVSSLDLFVAASASNQDQLFWKRQPPPPPPQGGGTVPEPTSLALAFGALGMLGAASRRRAGVKT